MKGMQSDLSRDEEYAEEGRAVEAYYPLPP